MLLFTIEGLDAILIEEGLISSLNSKRDQLKYDKCNWLITSILKKNYAVSSDFGDYANIHSETLRRMLGRDYKNKFLNVLSVIGIIVINDTYSTDRFSKSYSLTKYAIDKGVRKTEILSQRFTQLYASYLDSKFQKIYSDKLYRKILDNLSKLKVKGEEADYYFNNDTDSKFKIDRYDIYFRSLKSLGFSSDPKEIFKSTIFFEPKLSEYGRVYHLGTSIPRLIRRIMVTKDEKPLWEVDMSSAQLSILIMWWASIHNYVCEESEEFQKEYYRNLNLIRNGKVYEFIRNNSLPFKSLAYSKLKKQVLTVINANLNTNIFSKELNRLFPHFMEWINSIKRVEGYKSISHIGQRLESDIFVNVYKSLSNDIFSLIIHDCILTTEENTNIIRNKLAVKAKELFPFVFQDKMDFLKMFKVSKVSLEDEEYTEYLRMKYYEEIKEDLEMLNEFYEIDN